MDGRPIRLGVQFLDLHNLLSIIIEDDRDSSLSSEHAPRRPSITSGGRRELTSRCPQTYDTIDRKRYPKDRGAVVVVNSTKDRRRYYHDGRNDNSLDPINRETMSPVETPENFGRFENLTAALDMFIAEKPPTSKRSAIKVHQKPHPANRRLLMSAPLPRKNESHRELNSVAEDYERSDDEHSSKENSDVESQQLLPRSMNPTCEDYDGSDDDIPPYILSEADFGRETGVKMNSVQKRASKELLPPGSNSREELKHMTNFDQSMEDNKRTQSISSEGSSSGHLDSETPGSEHVLGIFSSAILQLKDTLLRGLIDHATAEEAIDGMDGSQKRAREPSSSNSSQVSDQPPHKRVREQGQDPGDDDDGSGDDNDDSDPPKRKERRSPFGSSRRLKCPFYQREPEKYSRAACRGTYMLDKSTNASL